MPTAPLVTVLLAPPGRAALTTGLLAQARSILPNAGPSRWLAPEAAVELAFTADPAEKRAILAELQRSLAPFPVDVAIVPAANRRKKLLVADMDSTLIAQECIDELADVMGLRKEISAITERSMNGEIDFVQSLSERVGLLEGLPETALHDVAQTRIALTPGAKTLAATMRRNGALTAIVSGGFTVFTGHVRGLAAFDRDYSNRLEVRDGRLTGKLVPPILDHDGKRHTLDALVAELGINMDETIAVGDGANDVQMIRAAGLGVAFRAKPVLREAADAEVAHGDLTALLYLQGYHAGEFVE